MTILEFKKLHIITYYLLFKRFFANDTVVLLFFVSATFFQLVLTFLKLLRRDLAVVPDHSAIENGERFDSLHTLCESPEI